MAISITRRSFLVSVAAAVISVTTARELGAIMPSLGERPVRQLKAVWSEASEQILEAYYSIHIISTPIVAQPRKLNGKYP